MLTNNDRVYADLILSSVYLTVGSPYSHHIKLLCNDNINLYIIKLFIYETEN